MARKLSQIALAGSSPGLTDTFVGVSAANADLRYSLQQVAAGLVGAGLIRDVVTAPRTYYVRTDGSNANTGLVDSAAGAFKDWTFAYEFVCKNLDVNGKTVTIQQGTQVFPVTYLGSPSSLNDAPLEIKYGWVGGGVLRIIGDRTTPSNVVLTSLTSDAIHTYLFPTITDTLFIAGFKLAGETGIYHGGAGTINVGPMEFGACLVAHLWSDNATAVILFYDVDTPAAPFGYTISGNASCHALADAGSTIIFQASTGTCVGSPAFATAFAKAIERSLIANYGSAFAGLATGARYLANTNSAITGTSSNANFFPGDVAGTADAATFGSYT